MQVNLKYKLLKSSHNLAIIYTFLSIFVVIGYIILINLDLFFSLYFLYHFFVSIFVITLISFLIYKQTSKPFYKSDQRKNRIVDIVLLSFLTLGFCGFIVGVPIIYLWILLFKKIKLDKKNLSKFDELKVKQKEKSLSF